MAVVKAWGKAIQFDHLSYFPSHYRGEAATALYKVIAKGELVD